MPLGDGATFRDRAVYLASADALVIADLHLGRGAASNVELPLGERAGMVDRIETLLDAFDPAEFVVAGDVLHPFSRVPAGAQEALESVRRACADAGAILRLLRGNHDAMLDALADADDEHRLADGTLVCHGHRAPDADADRYVVGHDHPAIDVEGRRRPCFLFGEGAHRDADVLALPAFNELAAGVEVNRLGRGDPQSPLLADVDAFRPVVRDPEAGETLVFPPLGSMREFL